MAGSHCEPNKATDLCKLVGVIPFPGISLWLWWSVSVVYVDTARALKKTF